MFKSYPTELISFFSTHGIRLPTLETIGGQALAWMAQPHMRGGNTFITREQAVQFFKERDMTSSDPIQPFNKPGGSMPGLKRVKGKRGEYSLLYPFEFNDIEKRQNVKENVLINGSKMAQVAQTKKYWIDKLKPNMEECSFILECLNDRFTEKKYKKLMEEISHIKWHIDNIIDVPISEWHIGHLDATKGNDPTNLYYQPPIQARYRDKYIFNHNFERLRVKA